MLRANWIGVFVVFMSTESASYAQVIDRILAAKEEDRIALVVEELGANAKLTSKKVLEAQWSYSGKYSEGNYGDRKQTRHRTSGKMHLVIGQDRFWAKYDYPFVDSEYDTRVDTFLAGTTHFYRIGNSKIVNVDIMCELPPVPEDLKIYSELTDCAPWREGKERYTPKKFQEFISSCKWVDVGEPDRRKSREISIKRIRPPDPNRPRSSREKSYRFSEINGQLVLSGTTSRLVSPQKYDKEEYDVIDDFNTAIEYRSIDGFLLPSGLHFVSATRSTNPDGTPFKSYKPAETKNVTWKLQKAKVLDRFPEEILEIPVPATARIVDHCTNQKERAERKQIANSGWTRTHWLIVGGLLCCIGIGLYWFRRNQK
ncbi:MAG: hypothetical protein ABL921_21835 [Pirellula sp.]